MSDCSRNAFRVPCPDEGIVLDDKKSYCRPWGRWTNCREANNCVYEDMKGGTIEEAEDDGAEL